MKTNFHLTSKSLLILPVLVVLVGLACNANFWPFLAPTTQPQQAEAPTTAAPVTTSVANLLPETEIVFRAQIPENSPAGQPVYLNILDEVTGLALNTQTYLMEAEDDQHYALSLPFAVGSLVKYRYSRESEAGLVEEHISDGRQLRYRVYHIEGPGEVSDVISRWTDSDFESAAGRITGHALDIFSGQPIPNLLVVAGGSQGLTASDGSFLLEGIPPGTHNLVAFDLNGTYQTFQQGAVVAAESSTPAELRLSPSKMVTLTFQISAPENTPPAVPVRMAGNLYQLGNTFSDLTGGVNTVATRMPVLSPMPEGGYAITLTLPAGADLRYFFTLGDGFWNTELNADGSRRQRQLIVPQEPTVIEDAITTWNSGGTKPLVFDVTLPAGTPPGDTISIQFNPFFGWTEPIPMWRLSETRWAYILNNPLQMISTMHYRYCRNDQCGSADAGATPGPDNAGFSVDVDPDQPFKDEIENWAWLSAEAPQAMLEAVDIQPRGADFVAGIEFLPAYHPNWLPLAGKSLETVQGLGANWLVLSPTWTFTRQSPPILDLAIGRDAFWFDLQQEMSQARARGLNVAINPTPNFPLPATQWWAGAQRDFSWWVVWFERYRSFIFHHADLAARNDAQALVLGGDWIAPALPGGVLSDGSPSGVPADADSRWRELIAEVRQRFSGKIIWSMSLNQTLNPPEFLDSVDQVYVQFYAPLSTEPAPAVSVMATEAGKLLDTNVQPLQTRFNKPIILAISYPSTDGASQACPQDLDGNCLSLEALARPNADIPGTNVNLQAQADIYNALLAAVNQRAWISGFISRGFYPPAALQDKSASVHGKPAQEILRFWFPKLLGN